MTRRRLPGNDHERLLLELLERERAAMIPKISLGRYTGIADYVLREGEFFDVLEAAPALVGLRFNLAYVLKHVWRCFPLKVWHLWDVLAAVRR